MSDVVVIADIGGTNARFEAIDAMGIRNAERFKCKDFKTIAEMAQAYFAKTGLGSVKKMILAVASPVVEDIVDFPNNHFEFSQKQLKERLRLSSLQIMNDFVAVAHAISTYDHADPSQIVKLNGDARPVEGGCISILGLGTGLGIAHMSRIDGKDYAQAAWGGAAGMNFKNPYEDGLRDQLKKDYGDDHISTEAVCCGPGLVRIYNALAKIKGLDVPPLDGAEISRRALSGEEALSKESFDLMMGFFGRIAGNNALVHNAHGGVYITGGMLSGLSDYIRQSPFLPEFHGKGAASGFVSKIPVYHVQDGDAGMSGLRKLARLEMA